MQKLRACIPQALGLVSPHEAQFNMVFCDLARMFYGRRHRLLRRWNPHRKRSGGLIEQCFVQRNGRRGRCRRIGHYHYRLRRNGRNVNLRWFCRSQLYAQSLRLRRLRLRWSNPLLPPGICGRSSPPSPRCRLLFRTRCRLVKLYTHPSRLYLGTFMRLPRYVQRGMSMPACGRRRRLLGSVLPALRLPWII